MGQWTAADKTSMVMPIGGLISGLTVIAGGIAGIVNGMHANEQEAGSGQNTLNAGITAIIAGTATATAGITAICRKIMEVTARDDGTGNDVTVDETLEHTRQSLEIIQVSLEEEADKLDEKSKLLS
jgi:hypothetical protein